MRITAEPRSDQWNADDFVSGPRTFTVAGVKHGTAEQKYDVELVEGEGRVWRPPLTVLRILLAAWGDDATAWTGRRVTLYRDDSITFGRDRVGGIRIKALSHIDKPLDLALTATRGKRAQHHVEVLAEPAAAPTPTPDDIAACDDQDLLRRWWIALPDRPDLRDLIQARVTEVRTDATRAATIDAEATAGAWDTLPVEGGAS